MGIIVEVGHKTDGVGEYIIFEVRGMDTDIAVDAQDVIDIGLKLKCRVSLFFFYCAHRRRPF